MSLAAFGPGSLYLTRTDVSPSTPVNIGFAQEFQIDITYTGKALYGQNQLPLQQARGTAKLTGKAKAAQISGIALNNAVFGQAAFTPGTRSAVIGEPHAVPATPYQVTIAPPGAGTFDADLGVVYASGPNAGFPLQNVGASGTLSAAGQYKQTAGTYTFYSADTLANTAITYTYTLTGSGQRLIVTNQPIGFTPTFQLDYITTNQNKTFAIRAFQCISDKLAMQFKLEDFMIPEIDFSIFQNAAGQVFDFAFPEVS